MTQAWGWPSVSLAAGPGHTAEFKRRNGNPPSAQPGPAYGNGRSRLPPRGGLQLPERRAAPPPLPLTAVPPGAGAVAAVCALVPYRRRLEVPRHHGERRAAPRLARGSSTRGGEGKKAARSDGGARVGCGGGGWAWKVPERARGAPVRPRAGPGAGWGLLRGGAGCGVGAQRALSPRRCPGRPWGGRGWRHAAGRVSAGSPSQSLSANAVSLAVSSPHNSRNLSVSRSPCGFQTSSQGL